MRPALLIGLVVALATACSSTESNAPDTDEPTVASGTPWSQLDGTWEAEVTQRAVRRVVIDEGYPDLVDEPLLQVPGGKFRLRFVGPSFLMSHAATGERWQSGTYELRGDTIVLDDEAPTGRFVFTWEISGEALRFSDVRVRGPSLVVDGVPDYLPGAGHWMAAEWVRVG